MTVLSNKALYPIEQYLIFHVFFFLTLFVAPVCTSFTVQSTSTFDVSSSFWHAPVHLLGVRKHAH